MKTQPTFRDQLRSKGPWLGAFLLVFIGASVAGWNYSPSSSTRRGGAWESAFKGLAYITGAETTKDVGLVWTGRLLVVLGLAAAGYGVWRLLRKQAGQTKPGVSPATPPSRDAEPTTPQVWQGPGSPEPIQPVQRPFPNPFNERPGP